MKASDYNAAMTKRKGVQRVKGAKRTVVDGIKFDSKKEAARWSVLQILQQQGEISSLERQVKIPLWGLHGPIMTDGGKQQRCYIADFRYVDWSKGGEIIIEDVKSGSFRTEVYALKRAILAAQGVKVFET